MKTILGLVLALSASAHTTDNFKTKTILASLQDLKALGFPIIASDETSGTGVSQITPSMQEQLQIFSHHQGKCGGFESLSGDENPLKALSSLKKIEDQNARLAKMPLRAADVQQKTFIMDAVSLVQDTNIQEMVTWLSSFKNRLASSPTGSEHIYQMKVKIEQMLKSRTSPWQVEVVTHSSTSQKSLRARLVGKTRPNEIIVLGGHHDSINHSWSGGRDRAPGADDNASGSANLYEVLRVLGESAQLERTVEVIWYAGEEQGLLGSAEIAKEYKQQRKDVIGVMQMDMTAYPGSGEMTISNITDFTNPWLQTFMKQINDNYVGLKIIDDKCGYGCSDHASWHRQGFAAVIPFEALSRDMNPNIHTNQDVTPILNFKHSAAIAKLSLAFAMELANSEARVPSL